MLRVNNLSVSYGRINAVRNISFNVDESEIVSLIGANGAGKTTTLMALSGIIKNNGGSAIYNGKEILGESSVKIVAQGVVQVPEGRQVFSKLTVEENLRMGGFLIKDQKLVQSRIDYVSELFPILAERKHQKAGSLSGGEQQMMVIGRALISGARLLLLDEPSLGLAPIIVKQVFDVIRRLREEGMAILLVEQNAREAMAISDRTYIMETGEIVMEGESSKLAEDPRVKNGYLGGDLS